MNNPESDAQIHACYYKALVSLGIDTRDALELTKTYLWAIQTHRPPNEPWKG